MTWNLASLSPNGRQVRCVRCRTVWHAEPSHADKLLHAAAALAPERDVPTDGAEDAFDRAADELASAPTGAVPARYRTSKLLPRRQPRLAETAEPGGTDRTGAIPMKSKRRRLCRSISTRSGRAPCANAAFMRAEPETSDGAQDIESVAAAAGCARSADRYAGRCPVCKPGFWRLRCSTPFSSAGAATWCARCRRPHPSIPCSACPVNLRGLIFDDVTTVTEQHEGRSDPRGRRQCR